MLRFGIRVASRGGILTRAAPGTKATSSAALLHGKCLQTNVHRGWVSPRSSFACTQPLLLQQRSYVTDDSGFHPDFKTKLKNDPSGVLERIKQDVLSDRVVVFMKGVPSAPQCGYSNAVVKILKAQNVKFTGFNALADPEVREGIKKFSNWPTLPQVFIDGEFVGGCDIMVEMHQNGELAKLLQPIKDQQAEDANPTKEVVKPTSEEATPKSSASE